MFYSILYLSHGNVRDERSATAPSCFSDINLEQLFYPIFNVKKTFDLSCFFYSPLNTADTVKYRQDVLHDLENESIYSLFSALSETVYMIKTVAEDVKDKLMTPVAAAFDQKLRQNYVARSQFLHCILEYCEKIKTYNAELSQLELNSTGLRGFIKYCTEYINSSVFNEMSTEGDRLREHLDGLQYNILMSEKGDSRIMKIRKYDGEKAFSIEKINALFGKFAVTRSTDDKKLKTPSKYRQTDATNIVLQMIAAAHKSIFNQLEKFCLKFINFLDETIVRFAREIQFYIGWLEHIRAVRGAGLPFCYPEIVGGDDSIYVRGMYDLALAHRQRGVGIITNDYALNEQERIVLITGPNQGGKSTFARAVGQMHYLASLGLCIPGSAARLTLCDNVMTHFNRQEDITRQSGQLQDDLIRLKALLDKATPRSILIINEIFASTTLEDALRIGGKMMNKLAESGSRAFVITFLDELAEHRDNIVSMASVIGENLEKRTFKFERRRPDSVAYAKHIALKYGLTFEKLDNRLSKKEELS